MNMSTCCYQDGELNETRENTQEKMFFVEDVGVSFKMIRNGAMCTGANAITGVCELEPLTVFRCTEETASGHLLGVTHGFMSHIRHC